MNFKSVKHAIAKLFLGSLVFGYSIELFANSDLIKNQVTRNLKVIRTCYDDVLFITPDLKGKVVIDWAVDKKGTVARMSVNRKKSTIKVPSLHACVMDKLMEIEYPTRKRQGNVWVTYSFDFS